MVDISTFLLVVIFIISHYYTSLFQQSTHFHETLWLFIVHMQMRLVRVQFSSFLVLEAISCQQTSHKQKNKNFLVVPKKSADKFN